jgi:hypothetical protein
VGGMLALLLLTTVVAAVAAGVLVVVRLAAPAGSRAPLDGHGWRWQGAGLAAGVLAAAVLFRSDGARHFLGLALAPTVALGWLGGVVAGERTRPACPVPGVVSASLAPRTPGRYLGRRSLVVMRGCFAAVVGLLAAAWATASPTDGTIYAARCSADTGHAAGPWPGGPYAVVGVLATLLLWLAAEGAVRHAVRRPATFDDPEDDEARRRLSARTATTAAVLGAVPNLGVASLTMGAVLLRTCPTTGRTAVAVGLLVAGFGLSIVTAAVWLLVLGSGGRAVVVPVAAGGPGVPVSPTP